jgi:PAS domain S-box-containing protein
MKLARKARAAKNGSRTARLRAEFEYLSEKHDRLREKHKRLREQHALRHLEFRHNEEDWRDDQSRLLVAQQELEASRELYAQLYDFAPVGYATLNHAGILVESNLTAAALLGWSREELIRRPLLPLLCENDRRKFLDYVVKLRAAPGTLTAEFEFRRKDEARVVLQLVSESSPNIRTAAGTIRMVLLDVTQRKRAEHALRESEVRFRTMADSAPVMIWVSGRNKLCSYFNRPWLEFAGLTLEQAAGNGWEAGMHPEDLPRWQAIYSRACETRQEFKVEYRFRRHDGAYRWLLNHGVARFTPAHEFGGFVGCCLDITERRQAEEATRQARDELEFRVQERTAELANANLALKTEIAEHRQAELARTQLAAIVESSFDAIVAENLQGRITSWNAAAERIFGYTAAEMTGRSFARIVAGSRSKEYNKARGKLMLGQPVEPFETVGLHKSGHRIEISLTVSPVKDMAGELVGTSTIARDVSRQKRLETEVVKISEREQQRIARDLHEGLGQQLAGISCLSNVLKGDLTARGAAEAAVAEKISRLLDTTVAQSRDLAHGLQPVAPEPGGLMSVLEGLASRVTDLFKVTCRFECPHPVLLEDTARATHLYRIAQEAVTNAVRHGRARRIEIALSTSGGRLILAVRNDGVPIRRGPRARKGMGLGIMHYRADKLGGNLVVQTGTDRVTEVVCTVPARARKVAA